MEWVPPLRRFSPQRLSNRFLRPEELARSGAGLRPALPGCPFVAGGWTALWARLEAEGWNPGQIELLHDQLRQGWPLAEAKRHVARFSGRCPLRDGSQA